MVSSEKTSYPSIYLTLGPDSRYWSLPGKALLTSYGENNIELEVMAVRLAHLVETIPYEDDRFDKLVAPLADRIESILKNSRPFGEIVETKIISDLVQIQLYRQGKSGYWIRIASGLRVPLKAYYETKKKGAERILDRASGLNSLKRHVVSVRKMGLQDFGNFYHFIDPTGRVVVKESSWVHDFGEEVRFSKSYFFPGEEAGLRTWDLVSDVVA